MSEEAQRPIVFVHVDVDGLWAVKAAYGLASGEESEPDPVLLKGLGRFGALFEEFGMKASFFVCGRDCQVDEHAALVRDLSEKGHEIASHSWSHRIGLAEYPESLIRQEIEDATEIIAQITGISPAGFRAPGFGLSPELIRVLSSLSYRYDSSLLPTSAGSLMRSISNRLGARAKETSGRYGSGAGRTAPLEPYVVDPEYPYQPGVGALVELPVAVTPTFRLPVHASVAMAAGKMYTRRALSRVLHTRKTVTYLFHAIDLVGGEETPGLPGGAMGRLVFSHSRQEKEEFVRLVLGILRKSAEVRETQAWLDGSGP